MGEESTGVKPKVGGVDGRAVSHDRAPRLCRGRVSSRVDKLVSALYSQGFGPRYPTSSPDTAANLGRSPFKYVTHQDRVAVNDALGRHHPFSMTQSGNTTETGCKTVSYLEFGLFLVERLIFQSIKTRLVRDRRRAAVSEAHVFKSRLA